MTTILCTFGVVLVCLHTFVVVRTSPMGRQKPSSLQRRLKRNLTALSRVYNLTQKGQGARNTGSKYSRAIATGSPKYKLDPSLPRAPPTNVRKVKLYSRYHYFVQMSKGGDVGGTTNKSSPSVLFELQSVQVGLIRMKHVASGRYLGMDKHGVLRGRVNPSFETLFYEVLGKDTYHTFRSYKYRDWFIGIRKSGVQKPGRHTGANQKAVLFLTL